ncbi:cytochrome b [Helicobacter canadensis]|uniref:Ubiquinol cytochrome c oxidoreductase, cytochrome b subunit n=1 Tax=Helicobacter canadensis MIT 98-5491 TaxID=537970 RepID=C5ZZ60_9HELI|nr:cytochrome bc complex cytochrome b subunit [Helicobacter canadensis]EES89318.1 ubiquinol cytochrome c oxidoreductase, cytochrome b subunit [Helicobacter canadensis MIT 98-5491]EFR48103.1 Cytochrome b(C-terminal)/b6/petD [Helicobacter canadensis MIT 98-5491]STO99353.1 ubiquinol cytochrome c oxidoreductase [Helicobacter canadensis]
MAQIEKANGIVDWLDKRLAIKPLMKVLMTEYWIPKNINFLWAMGIVLVVLFTLLVISGLFLLMYYKPDTKLAFDSVNYTIMQEVKYGWLWRHLHAVSASVCFLIIYIHMFVAIYYGSYKRGREMIWITGMVLFGLFSAEAFSGYMLPWGQMSYWAAAVITNLFGGIPVIGPDLVVWIRGNFIVADATLTRFFMLHVVLLPVVIMIVIAIHFYALRIPHVNNAYGEEIDFEKEAEKFKAGNKKESKVIPFWPMFLSKDFFVASFFLAILFYLTCYHYSFALDPINFDPADHLKTPPHIYPEWYFLWSYEILRGFFFSADLGLIAFGIANVIFMLLPWLDRSNVVAPAHKRPAFMVWFWLLVIDMIILTIYGKLPPTGINAYIGFAVTIAFFALLFVVLPIITKLENKKNS